MKFFAFFVVILMSYASYGAGGSNKVVYGEDNRKDLFETINPLYIKLAQSTAGMVSNSSLKKINETTYSLYKHVTLEEGINICPSEKFSQQPLLANCSGFLIADDTIVTAGHCFKGQAEDSCQTHSWVFGLEMESRKDINLDNIPSKNVYKCKKVIKAVLNEKEDFAVIKLNRKVVERKPVKYRKSGKLKFNTNLVVIGHPTMMPLKVSDGGTILFNNDPFQFTTTLDTFQGNSGSAVFDSNTGLLEGILVSGKTDYIPSDETDPSSCLVVNTCDMNGTNCMGKDRGSTHVPGENVTRITTILKYIK